jgi:hypothetical protein
MLCDRFCLTTSSLLPRSGLSAVPTTCKSFSVSGASTETCAVSLTEGFTYSLYTTCETVKGAPVLYLLDEAGVEVSFNGTTPLFSLSSLLTLSPDGYDFCPGDKSAALIEYFSAPSPCARNHVLVFTLFLSPVPCDAYPTPTAEFSLSIECLQGGACSGDIAVVISTKEPPVECPRSRVPPPPLPIAAQCSSFIPPTDDSAIPIVATPENTFVYAQTSDCPASCGKHCEAGCFFCSNSGVLPGMMPPADLSNTLFVAMSTSARVDGCEAAFVEEGVYKYKTGDLISVNGLSACLNGFYRASHTCSTAAACGSWTLNA